MDQSATRRVGRPPGSSREMLQEAAAELFLEQTYAKTTIDQIARRAGVSRNTFFNYFHAKSDLLWVEVDSALARLPQALADADADADADAQRSVTGAVRAAVLDMAGGLDPSRVPWALTQSELMGTAGDLAESALSRFRSAASLLSVFVARRTGLPADDLLCWSFTMAALAAAAAAARTWAGSGVSRGTLIPYVDTALSPVCAGFAPVLDRPPASGNIEIARR
ncbi:MAG: TetR family transcriptional regulator [Cryobacterium sp.]|nr:TetR family transcriptional regulator [Cryobacterium sp.]